MTLAQCTGVTPAPVCQPANLSQREANEQKFTSVKPARQVDSRQPLHDNNSQTSPGSTNSHKRSRTTSDSIVITPSEKRQTVLALSPERPLPAGQQWTTLEVQRVLSLTPGTRPAFKHSDCQHGSLETIQTNTAHNSPASCSPGSTVAAGDSPMRHTGPINTPSTKAKACANEQQGLLLQQHRLPLTSTEPQLGTEETASQESLEGTQAEADALIEESSYWVINTNDDEGHEERAWGALVTNISQSTFATVAAALGQSFSSWAKTKSFSAVDRLLWAARIHVDRVNFSFEGGADTLPLSPETDSIEGEMCSPSEAAERLATFQADGHITPAHHPMMLLRHHVRQVNKHLVLAIHSQLLRKSHLTMPHHSQQPLLQAKWLRSPQPAARRGWWGQPWSLAQQPEETGPSPIGGVWGALAGLDVAAEGTEVTPSGLRPPRGPSSTPLPQPASTDAFPHIPTSMSAGRALTLKPQGRSTQQEVIIADSEEPLVLHRQHGPAKRAFLDAHALPCSSPNSPPDPLCSYVPATADGASPMKGAQKKAGSPKAKPGKVGEVAAGGPGHVPNLADAEATAGGAAGHGKQGKHAARPGKGRSKKKTKAAPQMGPPGARYRAGLPAPRYQSHYPKPRTTPPSAANRLQPQVQIPAQRDAATHQQKSSPAAGSGGKDAAALHGWHGPGLGAGLSARNAVAALCSARRQTAEPRNAYSFPDSLSPPAEADGAEPHCSSPTGINHTGPAQQAKHDQHRSSTVAKVQLPGATARLQAPCVAEDRVTSAPPQQSRRRWQLKASAQANAAKQQQAAALKLSKQHPVAAEALAKLASREAEGIGQARLSAPHGKAGEKAGRKRGRDTGSIALDKPARKRQPPPRYDDMVGHSQLDSDMLQASPQAPADQGNVTNNMAAVNGHTADCEEEECEEEEEEERAVGADDSNVEGMDGVVAGPIADEGLAMPEPGCKRKRSKLQHNRMQQALLNEAAEPDSEAAAAASSVIPVKPGGQLRVNLAALGCSKCRWSAKGCKKCRQDREAALQDVGAADAEGQGRKAGQGRADQQDRQGRAAPSSPALSSPGGSRAMQRHRRSSLGGGGALPFGGHSFLLTAYSDEKQKERICHKITQLGGHLLEDVPKPQGSRRASLGGNASHPVLALFSGQPVRTTKVMYAHIKGIPIVKESWLLACVSAHKLLPFDALHLEGGKGTKAHQAFQGLSLHLAGSPGFMQSFGRLVQHAGGHLVSGVGDSTSPRGVHHTLQAPCDCILSDFPEGSDELQQVHRLARRFRVPVKDKAWAITGFEQGQLPALPYPSPTKPSTHPPSSPPLPSALTASSPTGQATRGPNRHPAAVANPGSTARRQPRGGGGGVEQQAGGAGQLLSGDIQWVGPSIEPPTGLGLTPSQHQTFYAAFARGGMVVKVGDFVELSPVPGEELNRLVQVAALWSEPTQARQRMLASCHRFYRASETCIQYGFPPHEVFSSQDIEAKVPLLAVLCKCSIVYGRNGPTGNHNYLCPFAYDYASNSLRGH
ncbi:hypothetical protein WJX82_008598 [Trebouxia sp. C0006]